MKTIDWPCIKGLKGQWKNLVTKDSVMGIKGANVQSSHVPYVKEKYMEAQNDEESCQRLLKYYPICTHFP